MRTAGITLERYEQAERELAYDEARVGLVVHGTITALVSVGLVVVNIAVAPEFPWSAFAVAGMVIGFAAHWWFGFTKLEDQLTAQQQRV
jgi:hypothetical protein